ncbi:MAG: hypothetical protein H0U46_07055, partial [Actinobacteria bacterium]|nr:hypothetical protein [Actinomycetota bacterium]
MKGSRRALLVLTAVVAVAAAAVGGGGASPEQAKTIVIGWAYDGKGSMAPFDGPALATATSHVKKFNKGAGFNLRIVTCDTQGNEPAAAKACAARLLGNG